MKLIQQPNEWSCMACCLAMVTGTSLDDVYKFLDKDGSRIIHNVRLGFTVLDMLYYLTLHNRTVTPLWSQIDREFGQGVVAVEEIQPNLLHKWRGHLLSFNDAIIIVGGTHAVVWNHDERKIYNPNGLIHGLTSEYYENEIWMVQNCS